MRRTCWNHMIVATAGVGLLFCSSAFADAGKKKEPKAPAPDGWYFLDEDVWYVIPDTTPRHFQQANLDLLRRDNEAAAREIRKGAAFVHFAARRETAVDTKEELQEAVLNLERLAANIEEHVAFSKLEAYRAFAKADAALARHHIEGAELARKDDNGVALGYRLEKATIGLESGYHWSGTAIDSRVLDNISDALALATALQEGSRRDGKQIQASVEAISKDVTALRKTTDAFASIAGRKHEFKNAPPLPVPDGFALVEDDLWSVAYDEPGHLFHMAQSNYHSKHFATAARELREAAAYVHIEERRATETATKEALSSSVSDLENVAKDIASGRHVGAKQLSHIFGRAHYELARARHAAARTAWEKNQTTKAGHELRAAMNNLEEGLAWSGHEFEAAAVTAAEGIEACCERLVKDSGWVKDEVGKAIDFVGTEIERLGKDI